MLVPLQWSAASGSPRPRPPAGGHPLAPPAVWPMTAGVTTLRRCLCSWYSQSCTTSGQTEVELVAPIHSQVPRHSRQVNLNCITDTLQLFSEFHVSGFRMCDTVYPKSPCYSLDVRANRPRPAHPIRPVCYPLVPA